MSTRAYIVIPVHNRKSSTKLCMECLAQQSCSGFRVIVVDDGSTDGTSEMIQKEFPETILLHGDGNLWWTGATNLGIRYALDYDAELIITLNNDVLIEAGYIEKLFKAHRENPNALIGSINLTQEEVPRLLYAGIESFNPWTAMYVKRGKVLQSYAGELKGLLPTYSLPGRGVLIPQKVFEKIGLFDAKRFPHYAADYDFSNRAAQAGFPLMIHTENPVFSPYEPTRPGSARQSVRAFLGSFFQFRSPNYLPVTLRYNYIHHPYKWYFPVFAILSIVLRVGAFLNKRRKILCVRHVF